MRASEFVVFDLFPLLQGDLSEIEYRLLNSPMKFLKISSTYLKPRTCSWKKSGFLIWVCEFRRIYSMSVLGLFSDPKPRKYIGNSTFFKHVSKTRVFSPFVSIFWGLKGSKPVCEGL